MNGELAPSVEVEVENDGADQPIFNEKGALLKIQHGDGSLTINMDGKPLASAPKSGPTAWFDNLADEIADGELHRIADDLLRGIEDDLTSSQEWRQEREQGIKLLGLKIEVPGLQGAADGAPVEGMSRVRHPLLQGAVLDFQANARSELLPTDGPVKIRDDATESTDSQDRLSNALEKDLNHYLTVTASEYYPDTDRMLFMLGFGGTAFKKVYFCPLRNRPVSETVDADDLIVNNAATDLRNAKRITHRSMMPPSTVKRLQILGVYRDVELSTPIEPKIDPVKEEKKSQQGVKQSSMRPEDRYREIYECYCELDVTGFEHEWKGKPSGLEIPYRVTIDVSSKQILSIVRNYDEDQQELPEAKVNFAKYTFVPGMGFYDIGLLHILGNTTNAVTAAWREMLDMGMFANFPGFLMADTGARQNTNIFRVPPGGAALVKTGALPLNQAIMPLPYTAQGMAPLGALVDSMVQTGKQAAGAAQPQVGEGTRDMPVGTMLAMLDQAAKLQNAVHKRMHAAQCEEFRLLVECFKEHPESFWQRNNRSAYPWDQETFLRALEDNEITPQADPNTSSMTQRLLKIAALLSLYQMFPNIFDPIKLATMAVQDGIGYSNPQQFFAPPEAMGAPPPDQQQKTADAQAKTTDSQARMITAQAKAKEVEAKTAEIAKKGNGVAGPTSVDVLTAQARMLDAQTKARALHVDRADIALRDANAQEDRQSNEKIEALRVAREIIEGQQHHALEIGKLQHDMASAHADRTVQMGLAATRAKEAKKPKPKGKAE